MKRMTIREIVVLAGGLGVIFAGALTIARGVEADSAREAIERCNFCVNVCGENAARGGLPEEGFRVCYAARCEHLCRDFPDGGLGR